MSQKAEPTDWLYKLQLAAGYLPDADYAGDDLKTACAVAWINGEKNIWEHKNNPGYFVVASAPPLALDSCRENWKEYTYYGERKTK